ncbi:DnaJ-domain-containing protein [Macrolepiota fuliginosa MF-IS2]|uniref:DnaJ-domain-containing protein n=1 Tax=Macrolepiota fuliginosa MF-IS2 TaxID=1400762 RepID=A0A9P5X7J2_9AGAR|nr:DnaJ-domain-containing protein [Macrolepiota fuliginosa MF-IS2]
MRLPRLALALLLLGGVRADQGSLYPPGLLPLINRANALLSTGQFNEAAKIYSEAIEQSPADYLLYYKRATAYFSLQRHATALDDFEKVLSLTSNTFDNAHLMKARIYVKEGRYDLAKPSLKLYVKAKGKKQDQDAEDLGKEIEEGEQLHAKLEKERSAQLWNACVETASTLLRKASHSVEVRTWRVECAFAAGDLESSVGDLSRLSHLLPPSTTLLSRIFRLSYFLLPPSPGAMNALKQCLHYDPDSKICLSQHRLVKNFDKGFAKVEEMMGKEDWRGVVKMLLTPGGGKTGDLWRKFEEALEENVGSEDAILPLVPLELLNSAGSSTEKKQQQKKRGNASLPIPNAAKISVQRQTLVRALCKSFTQLAEQSKGEEYKKQMGKWCGELLTLEGCAEDVDGLIGKSEELLAQEEFEEAVRVLEKAFEASGRSDRNIHARLSKAQKRLKQSKQKDYYKVLGVSRDADEKTIKKAFRQAAKTAHPDKGGSEAKMATLNEAYEVLSDPELRARGW